MSLQRDVFRRFNTALADGSVLPAGASIGCQASFSVFPKRKRLVVVAAAELWKTKAEGPGFPSGCGKARSVPA